jgi:hypothetical protein
MSEYERLDVNCKGDGAIILCEVIGRAEERPLPQVIRRQSDVCERLRTAIRLRGEEIGDNDCPVRYLQDQTEEAFHAA